MTDQKISDLAEAATSDLPSCSLLLARAGANYRTTIGAMLDAQLAARGLAGPRMRVNISDRVALPTHSVTNTASNTQFQGYYTFTAMATIADPVFTFGNHARTAPATSIDGPADMTIRLALWDGTTAHPIYWPDGKRDRVLNPGAQSDTEALFGVTLTKGARYAIVRMVTYASAPASFPATPVSKYGFGPNASEWGTALTDKTLAPTTITGSVESFIICGHLAVKGTLAAKQPIVGILGDSISSDNLATFPFALWAAGIPYVNLGIASLGLFNLYTPANAFPKIVKNAQAAGCTHVICGLWVNDLLNSVSAANIYAGWQKLKAMFDLVGIKLIVITPQPKTNATNDGEATAGHFATRQALKALVLANNGVGYGYIDLATFLASPSASDLWRTDVQWVSAISVANGGSGYVVGDQLFLPNNIQPIVTSVSGGAITGIGFGNGSSPGAFLVPPASPASQLNSWGPHSAGGITTSSYGLTAGTGATFNLTFATPSPTDDGTHPLRALPLMYTPAVADAVSRGVFVP